MMINPLALFAMIATGAIVTRMLIAAMFRDRVAAPNLTIVLGEAGISTRPSISPPGTMHMRPWRDMVAIEISPTFWNRRLYRMKFKHKRLLERIVAITLYFDADENQAQSLRDYVRHFLPVA